MSQRGRWFVLCRKADALSVEELSSAVAMPSKATARLDGEVLDVTAEADGETGVLCLWLETSLAVAVEAAEIADEYARGRPDHARVASCDARYVLEWDLADTHVVFDAYYTLAYRIADACHGVVFNAVDGEFVEA